jgi:hypothetical protein
MEINDWESMSTDELWNFQQEIAVVLSYKIGMEKAAFEKRLRQLEMESHRPRSPGRGPFMRDDGGQEG